jgi:hypothetical protein
LSASLRPSCENFEKYFRPLTAKQFGPPVIKTVSKVSFDHSGFRAIHPAMLPRIVALSKARPANRRRDLAGEKLTARVGPDRFDSFEDESCAAGTRDSHFQNGDVKIAAAITTLAMRTRCLALAIAR